MSTTLTLKPSDLHLLTTIKAADWYIIHSQCPSIGRLGNITDDNATTLFWVFEAYNLGLGTLQDHILSWTSDHPTVHHLTLERESIAFYATPGKLQEFLLFKQRLCQRFENEEVLDAQELRYAERNYSRQNAAHER